CGQEGVAVGIELCFANDGQPDGVGKVTGAEQAYCLASGTATFQKGTDRITFGPGRKDLQVIRGIDWEKYSVHFGAYPSEGQRVFITGFTPFTYTLTFS